MHYTQVLIITFSAIIAYFITRKIRQDYHGPEYQRIKDNFQTDPTGNKFKWDIQFCECQY